MVSCCSRGIDLRRCTSRHSDVKGSRADDGVAGLNIRRVPSRIVRAVHIYNESRAGRCSLDKDLAIDVGGCVKDEFPVSIESVSKRNYREEAVARLVRGTVLYLLS